MHSPTSEDRLSFFEQQVVTARNVKGGFVTDVVLVGLNLQIEHHLFPSCPRNKLRRLVPYVRAACLEANIPYVEMGAIETNRFLMDSLTTVARGEAPVGEPSLAT
jgi:fatty acid desaturase